MPFDDLDRRLGAFGLLDRRRALGADPLERVGDSLANRRHRCAPRWSPPARAACGRRPGATAPCSARRPHAAPRSSPRFSSMALAPAAMFLTPSAKIAAREQRRRRRAVADQLAGALGRLADHLRAEVLFVVLELELLGDRHAVVADDRTAPFLLDEHALRFRPSVTRTASASAIAPCRIFSRAADWTSRCL